MNQICEIYGETVWQVLVTTQWLQQQQQQQQPFILTR